MLVNFLQGKPLSRLLVFDEVDGAVGTVGDELDNIIVFLARGPRLWAITGYGTRA